MLMKSACLSLPSEQYVSVDLSVSRRTATLTEGDDSSSEDVFE
jgi:hypothetical protein